MPDKEGKDLSMFAKVENHEERITNLEEADRKHEERFVLNEQRMDALEGQYTKLQNTVMMESRETRDQVKNTEAKMESKFDRLFGVVETALGIGDRRDERKHVERMAKWDKVSTILLKWAGAGGVIYLMAEHFFAK